MSIKIETNISDDFKEVSITINAPSLSNEVQNIIKYISNIDITPNQIIASKNNEIYFFDLEKVICFFSKDKCNYVKVSNGIYKIKYKLYELEEILKTKDFMRISNSCIINVNQVECFDTSVIGTLVVKLKDNTKESVSKRNVAQIMKLLKERGNLK